MFDFAAATSLSPYSAFKSHLNLGVVFTWVYDLTAPEARVRSEASSANVGLLGAFAFSLHLFRLRAIPWRMALVRANFCLYYCAFLSDTNTVVPSKEKAYDWWDYTHPDNPGPSSPYFKYPHCSVWKHTERRIRAEVVNLYPHLF